MREKILNMLEKNSRIDIKDIMTPGPTQVRENVRQARALACTNPDLDADF